MSTPATPLAYRTVLHVRPPQLYDMLDAVRSATGAWLRRKYPKMGWPFGTGNHPLSDTSTLFSHAAYDEHGAEYATRLRLREDAEDATWRTTVTAVRAEEAGTVCVDLECFPNEGRNPRPGKPALVHTLVEKLQPHDGPARLAVNPFQVRAERVPDLVDVLCDPERRLPVLVAARPADPPRLWRDRIKTTVRAVAGDASVYLLEDRDAVDAFRDAVGYDHRLSVGSLRTFLPLVDPAWAPDAARHRVLGAARWGLASDHAWRSASRNAQSLTLTRPLPPLLNAVEFPDHVADQHRRERQDKLALAHQPLVADEGEQLRQEIGTLNALLQAADTEVTDLKSTLVLAQRAQDASAEQARTLLDERDAEMMEHLMTIDALAKAQGEADTLRRLLLSQGRFQEVAEASAVAPPSVPVSFEDLWERLHEHTHLTVSADPQCALDLDEHQMAPVWAAKAWTALDSLNSYARVAKEGFNGGFYQFCVNPPAGAKPWPIKQVAMVEGEKTMSIAGHERLFPAPGGTRVEMQAHLKIGTKSIAPRVYFLDEVKAEVPRLVVGYIGAHLTNTLTN
ncbi:hypothetical protein [Streptomyces sp. NRRL F-5630]|uniref:hypothetical protein n=1 Tax=Streptomyces sp. NRRL F-5630 TaxID=1463864 RepID=UPI003D72BDCB